MTLALDTSPHVADIAWIYSDVPGDYALSELCIMSRFRGITPEDKGDWGDCLDGLCSPLRRAGSAFVKVCRTNRERFRAAEG